jgi:hypothetical protein
VKKILRELIAFNPNYWLGIYGIYYCIVLIFGYDEFENDEFIRYTILPLIVLGSIQLFKKGKILYVVYSILIVLLINLILT